MRAITHALPVNPLMCYIMVGRNERSPQRRMEFSFAISSARDAQQCKRFGELPVRTRTLRLKPLARARKSNSVIAEFEGFKKRTLFAKMHAEGELLRQQ
uniref:Uncharacterized protein n=1 Tax=Ditylenchus dipsaci TaxID=166011 RepID=A0A915DWQ2_9BILA